MSANDLELARNLWRNMRSAISQVADRAYQKRVWLADSAESERSSFVEVYYLIKGFDIDVVRGHRYALGISGKKWELLLRFLVRFLAYYASANDVYAQEEILSDPEWEIVVAAARDAEDRKIVPN